MHESFHSEKARVAPFIGELGRVFPAVAGWSGMRYHVQEARISCGEGHFLLWSTDTLALLLLAGVIQGLLTSQNYSFNAEENAFSFITCRYYLFQRFPAFLG